MFILSILDSKCISNTHSGSFNPSAYTEESRLSTFQKYYRYHAVLFTGGKVPVLSANNC